MATGLLGAVLGLVATLSILQLAIVATWGGNTFAFGMMVVLFAPFTAIFGCVVGGTAAIKITRALENETEPGEKVRKMKNATLAAIAPVVLGCLAVYSYFHFDDQPSDAELIANFKSHQQTFERLVHMSALDRGLVRVDEDWTDPRDPSSIGVSTDRIETYKRLCREAHVPPGFSRYTGDIEFTYWCTGSAVSDDLDKGYVYLATPPMTTSEKLDGFVPRNRSPETHYRHIQGHWYLYIDYIPG